MLHQRTRLTRYTIFERRCELGFRPAKVRTGRRANKKKVRLQSRHLDTVKL